VFWEFLQIGLKDVGLKQFRPEQAQLLDGFVDYIVDRFGHDIPGKMKQICYYTRNTSQQFILNTYVSCAILSVIFKHFSWRINEYLREKLRKYVKDALSVGNSVISRLVLLRRGGN
jgi:hypothetical protein